MKDDELDLEEKLIPLGSDLKTVGRREVLYKALLQFLAKDPVGDDELVERLRVILSSAE